MSKQIIEVITRAFNAGYFTAMKSKNPEGQKIALKGEIQYAMETLSSPNKKIQTDAETECVCISRDHDLTADGLCLNCFKPRR